jgi:C1A family cysteine protease
MFKVLAVLCLLGTAALCASSKANANAIKVPPPPALDPTNPAADVLAEVNAFKDWKDLYGKKFDTEEDKFRFLTFVKNKNQIKTHNSNDKKKFTMDINQFAAETPEEFAAKHLGGKPHDQAYLDKIKLLKEGEIMTPIKIPSLEEIQALIEKQKNAAASPLPAPNTPASAIPAPTITSNLPNPNANPNASKARNLQVVPPAVPPPINWATLGKVSPIRDQGNCGSCYAFSTVAGVESAYLMDHN